MKGKYFGIVFAIILLLTVGNVLAALGQGSWIQNKGKSLNIIKGESAEFGYSITAVTSMGGKYSIMLFREGSSTPIKTYALNQPTIGNGAVGTFTVTPSDYGNTAGDYYVLINSVDSICSDSYRLDLTITNPIPLVTASCLVNTASGNAPLNVQFASQVSGGNGVYTYTWTFGDGQTSNNPSTTSHIYNTGTYAPTLTVRDSDNRVATASCGSITAKPVVTPIVASCFANPTSGDSPLIVQFTSQVSGGTGSYTYKWTFGDGQTSSANVKAPHTYATGTYAPTLTIKDSENHSTTVSCGTITAKPVVQPITATCYIDKTSGDAPLGIQFNSHVSGGNGQYTYTWTFGDGTAQSIFGQNYISHVYNIGTYNPTLTVRDTENRVATTNCGSITAKQPIQPINIICNAYPTSGNTPLDVQFTSTTTGGTGSYTYTWNFGDNTIINNKNKDILYKYYNPGTYIPTLTATDTNNNKASTTCGTINAKQPIQPLTGICAVNPKNGYEPLSVQFTSQVSGGTGGYTYTWTFGDGQTSFNQNSATHTYTVGMYYPKLIIKDSSNNAITINCDTIIANKVIPPVTATCYANPKSGDAPLNVQFTSTVSGGTGAYTYSWTFGDGYTSFNQNSATHVYSTAGIYNPTLTVKDSEGRSTSVTCGTITSKQPIPPVTATCYANPTIGDAPFGTQLNAHASGGNGVYTYTWTFGDGTSASTAQNYVSHVYNIGTYNPTLTVRDSENRAATANCGQITAKQPIQPINIICNAYPTSGNAPLDVQFTSTTTGGTGSYTYTWNFGDNTIINNKNKDILYKYYNPGTYIPTLTATDTNNNKASTTCGTINAKQPIQPLTGVCNANPKSGNAPLNVQFTSQISGGTGAYTYSWTFGDGYTSANPNSATHVYDIPGIYAPVLTVRDSENRVLTLNCGQINSIKVIPPITATCYANPTSGDAPLNVQFTSTVNGGNGQYTYSWTFGDGYTSANPNSATHVYSTAGIYNPTLTVRDSENRATTVSCSGTITAKEPIHPLSATCVADPKAGNVPFNSQFTSKAIGGKGPYTFVWTFGDGKSATTPSTIDSTLVFTHTYDVAGTYAASLKITDSLNNVAQASCGQITAIKVVPPLDVDGIYCFPRVTDGHNQSCSVFVKSNGQPAGNVDVKIYYIGGSLNGQLFGTCKTDRLSGGCELEREVYGVGTYTVYATASAPGYINDTDTYPRYTFEVFEQRYDIINLATYKDKNFFYPEDTFYRGQPLYAKFQIYDPENNQFVTSDIVTAAALVSLPGGRVDLSRMKYSGNWYYYELDAIPLTHDFLGDSNVFAFAFNFTGKTSGQAQVSLTILNNIPTITHIDDIYINISTTQYLDLDNYGSDLEDQTLRWEMTENSAYFSSSVNPVNNVLTITGISTGTGLIYLKGYDLDNDFATATITVHVLPLPPVKENLTVSCHAYPMSGFAPLDVAFTSTVNHGSGNYEYEWSFGDSDAFVGDYGSASHVYSLEGIYSASLKVTDKFDGSTARTDCGLIDVEKEIIPPGILDVHCDILPASGIAPLNVLFTVTVNNNTGPYHYAYDFGIEPELVLSQSNVMSKTYETPGTYETSVQIVDDYGNYGDAICGLVVADEDTNYTLVANAGGPYNGFINEPMTFDGSGSSASLGIVNYRWNFGDGTVVDSATPTVSHTYSKIQVYQVSLTVYDAKGHSRTAYTTATALEHSRYQNDTFRDLPDKGLTIKQLTIYGQYGEVLTPDDDMNVYLRLKNDWDRRLENVRVTASIPEYGFEARSTIFDIGKGGEEDVLIYLPVYDLPPGMHYVRITITNDDEGEQVRRVKYREVLVD